MSNTKQADGRFETPGPTGWTGRCPETTNLHYDHRYVPFSLGGPQEMWNLTLLCAEHNHAKGGEVQW